MSKIDVINEKMLDEFSEHNIEDTPENRLDFLQGLQQAWKEDPATSLEKTLWQFALALEITTVTFRIARNK